MVMISTDWSVAGQRVLSHCSWSWCFSRPGTEIYLRPRCYLHGGKTREGKVTLGVKSWFSQFVPLLGTGGLRSGNNPHLAVNCSAIVFSCLPQFPYCTVKEFFWHFTVLPQRHCHAQI